MHIPHGNKHAHSQCTQCTPCPLQTRGIAHQNGRPNDRRQVPGHPEIGILGINAEPLGLKDSTSIGVEWHIDSAPGGGTVCEPIPSPRFQTPRTSPADTLAPARRAFAHDGERLPAAQR